MPPVDTIYRESALALEALSGPVVQSWIATLIEIRCLPETTR